MLACVEARKTRTMLGLLFLYAAILSRLLLREVLMREVLMREVLTTMMMDLSWSPAVDWRPPWPLR